MAPPVPTALPNVSVPIKAANYIEKLIFIGLAKLTAYLVVSILHVVLVEC